MKTRTLEWLLGGGAFVALACCALPALVSGTVVFLGGIVVGSALLIVAGVALAFVGLRRRRPTCPVPLSATDSEADARIS